MFGSPEVSLMGFSLLLLLLALLSSGCAGDPGQLDGPDSAVVSLEPTPEALAALEKADAADELSDHVVNKCATCKLGMAGIPEHQAVYGQYTLLFCSEQCKVSFEKNPEKVLLSLN